MNTRLMITAALAASFAFTGAAMAADAGQVAAPQNQKTVSAMFAFADQDKNGQLTLAEATGHLPLTARNFADIDTARRGWISFEQFVAFTKQRTGEQVEAVLKVGASH